MAGLAERSKKEYADLAHLVERHLAKVEVAGSSPVIRSKKEQVQPVLFSFSGIGEMMLRAVRDL